MTSLSACNSAKNTKKALKDLSFLEGTWVNEEEGVTLKESWTISDGKLEGYSLLSLTKDTLFFENICISEIDGELWYKSSIGRYVIVENTNLPLLRSNKRTALFGNRNKLNTPYIFYQKRGNRLILEIRSIIDNRIEQDRFFMRRVQ